MGSVGGCSKRSLGVMGGYMSHRCTESCIHVRNCVLMIVEVEFLLRTLLLCHSHSMHVTPSHCRPILGSQEARRLLNLWQKLHQKLEPYRFKRFVEPCFHECGLLSEVLNTWIDTRLAHATKISPQAASEAALVEVHDMQKLSMVVSNIAQGNFTCVLGSWQVGKNVRQVIPPLNTEGLSFWTQRIGCDFNTIDQNQQSIHRDISHMREEEGAMSFHSGGARADRISDAIFAHARTSHGDCLTTHLSQKTRPVVTVSKMRDRNRIAM